MWILVPMGGLALVLLVPLLLGMRVIPSNRVGIVERLWSLRGSLPEGRLIALGGEAGLQAEVLRGGVHFGYWFWQFRVHQVRLTSVPQGKIGYVFARDGEALPPEQTLGRVVPSNHFQNARAFLTRGPAGVGQRGRQRAILREGVYAINVALFVVITEDTVHCLDLGDPQVVETFKKWHRELFEMGGFNPVVIDRSRGRHREETPDSDDSIGIVTVHDGPALEPGEIIAPPVATKLEDPEYHSNYQDIEAFLRAGGRRGRQYVPLTDGTYFLNRWFASVEIVPKTVVPIGFVGVVVSYFGQKGEDLTGKGFRHGEQVVEGERGVLAETLGPGKYSFNTYAGSVYLVPTTNFVLHWITGRTEAHRYDETLKSIDLVTADAYEPVLPLSVVVHIDYQKAPKVVQRFGDVKKLITQTLDPMLSAYFRDIAHKKTMLQLLHDRDMIQQEAKRELRFRFAEFDIELVDVLIGKPDTAASGGPIETLLEQLRLRQLAREQVETYEQQRSAAEKLRTLKTAQALAEKQTELTNSKVEVEIASNRGDAQLALARKQAEEAVVTAEAESKRRVLLAESEGRSKALIGEGESKRLSLEGEAEAQVQERKIASFGDPKLYALAKVSEQLAASRQPLVPERLLITGAGEGAGAGQNLVGTLLGLLVAEKSGLVAEDPKPLPKGGAKAA
jgi:uncharacterized membrane protein YqiK